MTPETAQKGFVFLNILAIPAVGYAVYDYFRVMREMANENSLIEFDSGTYYLTLMSVFWLLLVIQKGGLNLEIKPVNHTLFFRLSSFVHKKMGAFLVVWFVGCLVISNIVPIYVNYKFERSNYLKCKNLNEISRTARGNSWIYTKGECDKLNLLTTIEGRL